MSGAEQVDGARAFPRGLLILIGLAAAAIAISGVKELSGVLGPALLAAVLVITVYPLRPWLAAHKVPGPLASLAVVLVVYIVLALLVLSLVLSAGQLAVLIPHYTPKFNDLINHVATWLTQHGVKSEQIHQALAKLDVGQLVSVATNVFSRVLALLSNLLFISLVVLFAGFDAGSFASKVAAAHDQRPSFVEAMTQFAKGTRRYFAVSAGFGLICAALDAIALLVMGIPAAGVWAVLAFVTNFVPNVGFFIGLVPPAVLGLLAGGPGLMIAVIVSYLVINFVVQSIIQPRFVGDAVGISATLAFLSLVFWAYVFGPLGAILALPMTLLVKALLIDTDPAATWLGRIVSNKA